MEYRICCAVVTVLLAVAAISSTGALPSAAKSSQLQIDEAFLESPWLQERVNEMFDVIFAKMRVAIADSELDPLDLPSDEDTFDITLFNVTSTGSVWVGDGTVTGLGTIHRAGNMTVIYEPLRGQLVLGGTVGLTGSTVSYSGSSKFLLMGSKFSFEFEVPFLSLDFQTKVFLEQAEVELEQCSINEFSYLHVDLSGFGPVESPLYQMVVNMLLQVLNKLVKEGLQVVLCTLLENAVQDGQALQVM